MMIDRTQPRTHGAATDRAPLESTRASTGNAPKILAVDEAIEQYPGAWLLMRVTGHSSRSVPSQGEVIARSDSNAEIFEVLSRELRAAPEPRPSYYVFQANPRARSGAEMKASLADMLAQDDRDARGLW